MIRKNTWLDEGAQRCRTKFPIIKHTESLQYNEYQAVAMAKSLKKHLEKNGHLAAYEEELADYKERGVLVFVSRKEISDWQKKGKPVAFISHHAVIRPDKATTKVRLVSNASLKSGKGGSSPNQHWPKGPNILKPLLEVFARFRCNHTAVHFDVTKMYHSVATGDDEKMMQLMVWFDSEGNLEILGPTCVMFGVTPAASIMEVCKDMAAEAGMEIDEVAATAIREDTYIDDGCTGGSKEEADAMIGDCWIEDDKLHYNGTIPQILKKAGFKVKMMIRSGSNPQEALEKMGDGILGHVWEPLRDEMSFPFSFHCGKRKRNGEHDGPKITPENVDVLGTLQWTKRTVLSAAATQYDPSGLVCALTIQMRIFLRTLIQNQEKLDWDTPLNQDLNKRWNDIVANFVLSKPPIFPRRARPEKVCGPPEFVLFSDGSNQAYCAVLYLRWPVQESSPGPWSDSYGNQVTWKSFLLMGKSRVTPIPGISIPWAEANGLLYAYNLAHVCL